MAENIKMKATKRELIGKTKRRLEDSKLAGVVYGTAVESFPVSVERHDFEQVLAHESNISSKLIDLKVDGEKLVHVIVKSMQHDPLKGIVTHVDFWAVNMKQAVATTVPVHFEGDAPGLKNGGVFMHNVQHINVEALPDDLPEFLTADISALEIGDNIHVRDLVAPEGVTILDHEDEIVASVVAPAKEEEVAEEAVEPEVIGAKPEAE
ncbi:MAG TPA: 50S ribosomal protein L25 [Coriobacteriia bacterium]